MVSGDVYKRQVFGEVMIGMSHVDAINNVVAFNNDDDESTSGDQPIDDVRLISATVM